VFSFEKTPEKVYSSFLFLTIVNSIDFLEITIASIFGIAGEVYFA